MTQKPVLVLACALLALGACQKQTVATSQTATAHRHGARAYRFEATTTMLTSAPYSEPPLPMAKAPPPGPAGPAYIGTMSRASVPGEAQGQAAGPASLGTVGRLPASLTDPDLLARQTAVGNKKALQSPAEYCRARAMENRPLGGACAAMMGRQGA